MCSTVDVVVLTFKRPDGLASCLSSILTKSVMAEGYVLRRILIVDNDPAGSGEATARDLAISSSTTIEYYLEPEPGVSAARNRALRECGSADFLVFIDDDEVVSSDWPAGLLRIMTDSNAVLVGGPVRTTFVQQPPDWVLSARYFDRTEPGDGTEQSWLRSGNLAIRMSAIGDVRFDPRFGLSGGEDVAFSATLRRQGRILSWSEHAVVTEVVGPERVTEAWIAARQHQATKSYYRAHSLVWPRSRVTLRSSLTGFRAVVDACFALVQVSDPDRQIHARINLARARGAFAAALIVVRGNRG